MLVDFYPKRLSAVLQTKGDLVLDKVVLTWVIIFFFLDFIKWKMSNKVV